MRPLTLHIEGMSCGHCLNAVNRALAALPGVEIDAVRSYTATVMDEVSNARADVRYDESAIAPDRIEAAITEAGYRATAA